MEKIKSVLPGVSRVISNATPIIILFVFSKLVGESELGLLSYFISLITLLGVFTDFGLPEAVQTFLPKDTANKLITPSILLEFLIVFVIGLLFLTVDLMSGSALSKGYSFLLFLIIFFSSSNTIILIFNGLRDNLKTSFFYFFSSVLFIIVTIVLFVFMHLSAGESFLYGRLFSWIVFTIIPIIYLAKESRLQKFISLPKRFITFSANSLIMSFSYSIFNQWDSIVITNVLGLTQNGIYKSVSFLASLPYVLSVVLLTKLLPEYSELTHKNDIKKIKESFYKYTNYLGLLAVILPLISLPFVNIGLTLFYNPTIANNGSIYFPLILLSVLIYVAASPSSAVLLATHNESIVRNASLIQSITFIILSVVFLSTLGLIILPILLITLNIIYFLITFFYSKKILK